MRQERCINAAVWKGILQDRQEGSSLASNTHGSASAAYQSPKPHVPFLTSCKKASLRRSNPPIPVEPGNFRLQRSSTLLTLALVQGSTVYSFCFVLFRRKLILKTTRGRCVAGTWLLGGPRCYREGREGGLPVIPPTPDHPPGLRHTPSSAVQLPQSFRD